MVQQSSPLQYLDKALGRLRELNLLPAQPETNDAPIVALLQQISNLDEGRVVAITRTLAQASTFNDVVREQVAKMNIGTRYESIANQFNSIRDDAKMLVDQLEDGEISTMERLSTMWMKVTRGDIATRFDKIKDTYLEVTRDTQEQVRREQLILDSYRDFRGALKEAEILSFEVLKLAGDELDQYKAKVGERMDIIDNYAGEEPAERGRLELSRDEAVRELQDAEKRYQIAKDLSDNLTVSYHTTEVVMARLLQTTNAKERVAQQAISFFSTNETVLTALSASFTGMHGLHESTRTVEVLKDGVSDSLETLADIGSEVQERALRAGYGPTLRADSVKKLVDSVVSFQEHSFHIIEEMRTLSTKNAEEIRETVEDGKRRLARLAEDSARANTGNVQH